jgi:mannosylglycoprotein endo-beta-mannosidase
MSLEYLEQERNTLLKESKEIWHQCSRVAWIKSGDQNSKFFHKYASFRRNSKYLWEIHGDQDLVFRGQEQIKTTTLNHFKDFYKEKHGVSIYEQVRVASFFPKMIEESEAEALYKVDKEELQKVIKKIKVDKSLSPDGWTVDFFKQHFEIVGDDLLDMVEESRQKGFIPGALNSTFITIIPKVNKPNQFGDFKPISLCNPSYKIISKIITDRIKPFLSKALSKEQLGFLHGRQIQDVIGIVHECIHSIKKKKIKSLVLKLDLQKAYDCINWDMIRMILLRIGLGQNMTQWIMSCVISSTLAMLINGEATEFFKSGRGIRQGSPLSLLLLILVMEGLSLLLKDNQNDGILIGIKVS